MSATKLGHSSVKHIASHMERMIEDPDGVPQRVRVNIMESPLTWLYARKHVTERQYHAGDMLRRDWELAGLGPRVTMRWDISPTAQGGRGAPHVPDATTRQLSARQRMEGALGAAG
ncbi:MAG: DUF6456 domain-containing protein, partial [Sphingobium sp.]